MLTNALNISICEYFPANHPKDTTIKVTAFIGSARKQHTYHTTEQFLRNIQSLGNVDYEIVRLSEYNLQICRDCKLCTDKGEELCPLNDDRINWLKRWHSRMGWCSQLPTTLFQVSGLMKVFLDRFNLYLHLPQFFGQSLHLPRCPGCLRWE